MNLECALSSFYGRLRQWNGCRSAVSEGAQTKLDEVCSSPVGGQPVVATWLDDGKD